MHSSSVPPDAPRSQEARLKAILDTVVDAIITIDERGLIETVNPAAERIFGYAAAEMVGRNVRCLMPEPYRSGHDGYLRRYLDTRVPKVIGIGREVVGQRRDGTVFPMELAVSETVADGRRFFTGIVRDITARKAAETQQRLLEKALQSAENSVVITDTKARILWVNDAFTRMTGYAREEAVGASTKLLKSGRHSQPFYARLWQTVQSGEVWHGEVDNRRKDGSVYPEEMTITPVLDEAGAITHFIAIKQDITERKRLERLKSEFVSTVSHELRTPLTSIRGSLGLLVGGAVGELPDKAKGLAQIACNNSDRLVRLINDILDVEKIESGRMGFSLRPLLLAGVAREAVAANEGFAREHGVAIALDNALPGAKVLADPDRLNQVITNLISNAAKFSPQGETVRVAIAARGEGVRLTVADCGPGIPDEFRGRIFQKFSQADSSDTRKVGGSGLGLTISKAIVERFGGELSFDSVRGAGASFHVDLPVWKDAPIVARAEGMGPAVLVCEDDADAARVLAALLESRGMQADVAYSAEEAWQKLAERDYAAMTLDLRLPGQDGLSLLRQMRGEARTAHLPVVIVSGEKTAAAERQVASLDVEDWLLKPIDGERLVRAVRHVSGRNPAGRPRVLHVEDDADIVSVVAGVLEDVAQPVPAFTLAEARAKLAADGAFDLILLDIALPDGSGLDLLPEAAARGIPVVIFSAHEPDSDTAGSVAAVLVKSRTDNARLAAIVEKNAKTHHGS
jgi:PAS domain S-box-containing protein